MVPSGAGEADVQASVAPSQKTGALPSPADALSWPDSFFFFFLTR